MRKWCPDPLDVSPEQAGVPGSQSPSFEGDSDVSGRTCGLVDSAVEKFETDPCLVGRNSLWELLNQREKDQLLAEVRAKLVAEFEQREDEINRRQQSEIEENRSAFVRKLSEWSREMAAAWERDRHERAAEAAGLAIALARKIIRDHVDEDRQFLTRTVETALYKIEDARPVTVVVHPADASYLNEHPEMLKRLRIGEVVPDRRVEEGGCRIRSGERELDATIGGQLEALGDVLTETLAAQEATGPDCRGGNDDSDLD